MVALSVVVPLHDEAAVVHELATRCAEAAGRTGLDFELVFVDDASQDDTRRLVEALDPALKVRCLPLETNRGQLGATQAGLAEARGRIVVVLDGDLQDPPELIEPLVRAFEASAAPIAWAVKHGPRREPLWFRAGRAGYELLRRALGSGAPPGAGSFCALEGDLARRIGRTRVPGGNLSVVAGALDRGGPQVPYSKASRYDGVSRVGWSGLVREAGWSLWLASAPGRRSLRRGG